jgi:hypothetical protein
MVHSLEQHKWLPLTIRYHFRWNKCGLMVPYVGEVSDTF